MPVQRALRNRFVRELYIKIKNLNKTTLLQRGGVHSDRDNNTQQARKVKFIYKTNRRESQRISLAAFEVYF